MKLLTLAATALAVYGTTIAQIQNFDLSKYQLPELKRHSLELGFNSSGFQNNYKSMYNSNHNSFNFSGNGNLDYNYFSNSESLQRILNTSLKLNSSFENSKSDYIHSNATNIQKTNSFRLNPYFNTDLTNRNYFKPSFFYETNIKLSCNYSNYRSKDEGTMTNSEIKEKETVFSAIIPLKIGKGRIEPVEDARQAIYILDELSKQGKINRSLSDEDVLEFSKFISELKNMRFFDSRIRKIYELEAIDSFLNTNNYIEKMDARYFTTLEDFWSYGNSHFRNNGQRFSFSLYPCFYREIYENNIEMINNTFIIDAGVEYNYEKPINLSWQNTIEIKALIGTTQGKTSYDNQTPKLDIKLPNFRLKYLQQIGFFPNTRTSMSFNYSLAYIYFFDKYSNDQFTRSNKGSELMANTVLQIYYYLSPQLKISLYSKLNYIWRNDKSSGYEYFNEDMIPVSSNFFNYSGNRRNYNHLFSVSLAYSIF